MTPEAIKFELGADRIKWELTKRSNAGDDFACEALELIELLEDRVHALERELANVRSFYE